MLCSLLMPNHALRSVVAAMQQGRGGKAAAGAPAPQAAAFAAGAVVVTHGFVRRPELNGLRGTVLRGGDDRARVDLGAPHGVMELRLKNLREATEEERDEALPDLLTGLEKDKPLETEQATERDAGAEPGAARAAMGEYPFATA